MKKAFTVIELIISVTIIAGLTLLIFRIYSSITTISIRVENEKLVNNELLFLSQTVQNLADKYDIDLSKYNPDVLSGAKGITGTIYLTGADNISVYLTGNCENKNCWVEMNKNGEKIELTDKNKVYLKSFYFKIIPWKSYDNESLYGAEFDDVYHRGFWMFADIYTKKYNAGIWQNDVKMKLQTFFNIRKY